jgi:hypothetical protein
MGGERNEKNQKLERGVLCLHHLRILKQKGLVHRKFRCLGSKRLEKAYAMYFTERLPVYEIGRKAGLKNFAAVIRRHRKSG